MTFDRKRVLAELAAVMPGIDKDGSLIEGADTFQFSGGRVYSFNEEISASVESSLFELEVVQGDGEEELVTAECAIKADEFFKLLGKLTDDELEAERKETALIMKGDSVKVELPVLPPKLVDKIEGLGVKTTWKKKLPPEFQEALRACLISGNDTSFDGICVDGEDMLSADHSRINRFSLSAALDSFWITTTAAQQLCRLDALTHYQVGSRWVHFKSKPAEKGGIVVVFSTKRLRIENFPIEKIRSVVAEHVIKKGDTKLTFPPELKAAIDRASIFAVDIESFNSIALIVSAKSLKVYSNRRGSKFMEVLKWEADAIPDVGDEKTTFKVDVATLKYSLERSRTVGVKRSTGKEGTLLTRLVFDAGPLRHISSTIES